MVSFGAKVEVESVDIASQFFMGLTIALIRCLKFVKRNWSLAVEHTEFILSNEKRVGVMTRMLEIDSSWDV